jgi:hypothetical protein
MSHRVEASGHDHRAGDHVAGVGEDPGQAIAVEQVGEQLPALLAQLLDTAELLDRFLDPGDTDLCAGGFGGVIRYGGGSVPAAFFGRVARLEAGAAEVVSNRSPFGQDSVAPLGVNSMGSGLFC